MIKIAEILISSNHEVSYNFTQLQGYKKFIFILDSVGANTGADSFRLFANDYNAIGTNYSGIEIMAGNTTVTNNGNQGLMYATQSSNAIYSGACEIDSSLPLPFSKSRLSRKIGINEYSFWKWQETSLNKQENIHTLTLLSSGGNILSKRKGRTVRCIKMSELSWLEWEDEYGKWKKQSNIILHVEPSQKWIDENPPQEPVPQLPTETELLTDYIIDVDYRVTMIELGL